MITNRINTYLSWLKERGLHSPIFGLSKELSQGQSQNSPPTSSAAFTPEISAEDETQTPQIPELEEIEVKVAVPSVAAPTLLNDSKDLASHDPFKDSGHEPSHSESQTVPNIDNSLAAPTPRDPCPGTSLEGRALMWLDLDMPSGLSLHSFSKLCRALNLQDKEFCFQTWPLNRDISELLELANQLKVSSIIGFSPAMAELICDESFPNIQLSWQKTAYPFTVLCAPSLDDMISTPQLKINFWQNLSKVLH